MLREGLSLPPARFVFFSCLSLLFFARNFVVGGVGDGGGGGSGSAVVVVVWLDCFFLGG